MSEPTKDYAALEAQHTELVARHFECVQDAARHIDMLKAELKLIIGQRDKYYAELSAVTAERDEWRNQRHQFEAFLFVQLQEATGRPDDATVPEMIAKLTAEREALKQDVEGIVADFTAVLEDRANEQGHHPHLLWCNFSSMKLGDQSCNCPLGRRIYQAEADLAALREQVKKLRPELIYLGSGSGDASDWLSCLVCGSRWRGDERHKSGCILGGAQ